MSKLNKCHAICSLILIIFFSGCVEINKKTLQSYPNQNLSNWYQNSFYKSIILLSKSSPKHFATYQRVENNFLGIKINYDARSSGMKVSSNEGNEKMNAVKVNYSFIDKKALSLYSSYIKKRNGKILIYKPLLTHKIVSSLRPKIIYGMDLKACNYGRIYVGKIKNNIDSAFVNIICYEESPHPLFKGQLYIEPFSIIGTINGTSINNRIDLLPNSLLKETFIEEL